MYAHNRSSKFEKRLLENGSTFNLSFTTGRSGVSEREIKIKKKSV